MQEKSVTASGVRYKLAEPFFVLATQNPIEQEGTYPLPEAQLDRFMFNVVLNYPTFDEELEVIKKTTTNKEINLNKILDADQILHYQRLIRKMPVANNVIEYAVRLVAKTRPNTSMSNDRVDNFLAWGAGPRASQYLIIGSKCHAAINGKYSPDIEDVKAIADPILRHRLVKTYQADAEGVSIEQIIQELL